MNAYQVDNTNWRSLVLDALGEQQKALASLRGMGGVLAGFWRLVLLQVLGDGSIIESLGAEPEVVLGESERSGI